MTMSEDQMMKIYTLRREHMIRNFDNPKDKLAVLENFLQASYAHKFKNQITSI